MLTILYKPAFIKKYNKLDNALRLEVKEKIEEFRNIKNHLKLNVHKLHGELNSKFSFSVNFQIRIMFEYQKNKKEAHLLSIGSHDHLY